MSSQEESYLAEKGAAWMRYGPAEVQTTVDEFLEDPNSNLYVPIELWGKDHWSTFAYIETRDRERSGRINSENMRTHPRVHQRFATRRGPTGGDYPTRLKRDIELDQHDDWSCLEDMAAHGLAVVFFKEGPIDPKPWESSMKARAFLTEKGSAVADQLLAFKREDGNYYEFEPDLEGLEELSTDVPERAQEFIND